MIETDTRGIGTSSTTLSQLGTLTVIGSGDQDDKSSGQNTSGPNGNYTYSLSA